MHLAQPTVFLQETLSQPSPQSEPAQSPEQQTTPEPGKSESQTTPEQQAKPAQPTAPTEPNHLRICNRPQLPRNQTAPRVREKTQLKKQSCGSGHDSTEEKDRAQWQHRRSSGSACAQRDRPTGFAATPKYGPVTGRDRNQSKQDFRPAAEQQPARHGESDP